MKFITKLQGAALAASLGAAGFLSSAGTAVADTPAGPGVAGITGLDGYVTVVRGDSGEQSNAVINAPLLAGDYVVTGQASHAQIALSGISMLRLAQSSQVRLVSLQPGQREVQLAAGTAELSELQGADGGPQIDAPPISVQPRDGGRYRITVEADGTTYVTVRRGTATIITGAGQSVLSPGTTLIASGSYNNPTISDEAAIALDGFDTYYNGLDQQLMGQFSSPYLAPQLAGYADWTQYGSWVNVPGYGYSWEPNNESNGWAPYQDGQWVFEPGYGYTWVGDEPWGYAPYHYGNWYFDNNQGPGYGQWLWAPPAYAYQQSPSFAQSWLPAMVGFFMTGTGSGYGGYNNIGWVPLAPGEAYQPWYGGYSGGYAYPQTGVTVVNNYVNVTRIYRNINRYPVRTCELSRFGSGCTPVRIMHPEELTHVAVVRGGIPVVPTRQSLAYSHAPVRVPVTVSQRFEAGRFATKAPKTTEMQFTHQQAVISRNVQERPAPVEQRPAPVEQRPAPVEQRPAPVEQRPTPVEQRPAPVEERTAPPRQVEQQRPAPVEQRPAPVEQRPVPVQQRLVPAEVHTAAPRPAPEQQHPIERQPQQQQARPHPTSGTGDHPSGDKRPDEKPSHPPSA